MNLTAQFTLTRDEMESRRLEAAAALKSGSSQAEVARRFGVSRTTASRWSKALSRGVDALRKRRAPGRPCRLSRTQMEQVRELFAEGPRRFGYDTDRWTTLRLAGAIEVRFGVRYDPDHVGRIMHRLGLRSAASPVLDRREMVYPVSLYSPGATLRAPEISPTGV
jgi:putative transposase